LKRKYTTCGPPSRSKMQLFEALDDVDDKLSFHCINCEASKYQDPCQTEMAYGSTLAENNTVFLPLEIACSLVSDNRSGVLHLADDEGMRPSALDELLDHERPPCFCYRPSNVSAIRARRSPGDHSQVLFER